MIVVLLACAHRVCSFDWFGSGSRQSRVDQRLLNYLLQRFMASGVPLSALLGNDDDEAPNEE